VQPRPTLAAGSSSRTRNTPPVVSTLLPTRHRPQGAHEGHVSGVGAARFRSPISTTFRRRERSVNMAKARRVVPNATIPEDLRTMITATQCRCARTLLRWSVSKLSSAASVSESAIDDFELERRQPSTTTTDAIRRAFEGVGVVFLPQDDVQLRSDVSAAPSP
jgi:hypothetical protein